MSDTLPERPSRAAHFTPPSGLSLPAADETFDIPILLGLTFWCSLVGVILERSQILLGMLKAGGSSQGAFSLVALSMGSLLLNFASLLSIALIVYYLLAAVRAASAAGRILVVIAGLFAALSILSSVAGLVFQATVAMFLASQLMALLATLALLLFSLRLSAGFLVNLLMVLPVLSFLLLQVNQVSFFFPYLLASLLPAQAGINVAAYLLFAGQLVFLLFAGEAAFLAITRSLRARLPVIVPAVIALTTLLVSGISIVASERARTMFFRIIEVQYILPYSLFIYPLVFSFVVLTVALFLTGRLRDPTARIRRLRAGYAIGFIALGTFTPATSNEALFLLLGMTLWLHLLGTSREL
jgi:hypothetical protein